MEEELPTCKGLLFNTTLEPISLGSFRYSWGGASTTHHMVHVRERLSSEDSIRGVGVYSEFSV